MGRFGGIHILSWKGSNSVRHWPDTWAVSPWCSCRAQTSWQQPAHRANTKARVEGAHLVLVVVVLRSALCPLNSTPKHKQPKAQSAHLVQAVVLLEARTRLACRGAMRQLRVGPEDGRAQRLLLQPQEQRVSEHELWMRVFPATLTAHAPLPPRRSTPNVYARMASACWKPPQAANDAHMTAF